jgi:uncharacterized ferredoxin-like protein
MFKHAHHHGIVRRFPLTWGETILAISALLLAGSGLARMIESPTHGVLLLLAAVTLAALIHERLNTRRVIAALAERLCTLGSLPKFEVSSAAPRTLLDQALNRAIQRSREQMAEAARVAYHQTQSVTAPVRGMVAVLGIGLRQDPTTTFGPEHLERLERVAQAVRDVDAAALARVQGDGTLLIIFDVGQGCPIGRAMRQALAVARKLAVDESLRFGVSCGEATIHATMTGESLVIGVPLEDAGRLARMAIAWHEYRLLCTEPVALLARDVSGQRTALKLTHPGAPTLPVYALDVQPSSVAISA